MRHLVARFAFKVGPDGFQVGHRMLMFQWQDGKKAIVWPEELAPVPDAPVESTPVKTLEGSAPWRQRQSRRQQR